MVAGDPRERDQGKRLLVLGAGPAQLGLLAAARARELHVIAVDREPSAPGFRYADRRAIVSTEDESGIERLTGWRARTSFEEGLARTIAWYRENEAWWRGILQSESKASVSSS